MAGKKCANFGELTRAGFRVPQGFTLAVAAYEKFMHETGIISEIKGLCHRFSADPDNPADVPGDHDLSKAIRKTLPCGSVFIIGISSPILDNPSYNSDMKVWMLRKKTVRLL